MLKDALRSLARPIRVKIRAGPCAGMRFSLATRARFLSGTYEPEFAEFLRDWIQPGEVFWDVGAHFGYYTLLAAKAGARVFSFEPLASNRAFLEAHVRWNRIDATVFPFAIGQKDGRLAFGAGRGSGSRRAGSGPIEVDARSVDSLVATGTPVPDRLKIDVQGGEADVLAGAERTLREHPCALACATHGTEVHARCMQRLTDYGYTVRAVRNVILAFAPGVAVPDVDVATLDM